MQLVLECYNLDFEPTLLEWAPSRDRVRVDAVPTWVLLFDYILL